MKIRIYWEYPDFYISPYEDTYEDIQVSDNYTNDEIEKLAKEIALEHFGWSWERLEEEDNKDED